MAQIDPALLAQLAARGLTEKQIRAFMSERAFLLLGTERWPHMVVYAWNEVNYVPADSFYFFLGKHTGPTSSVWFVPGTFGDLHDAARSYAAP
jgi:hypothetical protein